MVTADTPSQPAGAALLHELLVKTSRTFALAIPQLPRPTVDEVTLAYLLFRIADTFEDATVLWSQSQRLEALAAFSGLLEEPSVEEASELGAGWVADPPTDHDGYLELLRETPAVIEGALTLSPEAREIVVPNTVRTADGMAGFVRRADDDGVLRLVDLADLRSYCYVVAGIVGEMLTDLFILGRENLTSVAQFLRSRAALFGEGLQLVNILKDSAADRVEGRNFVPPELDRALVFEQARNDLIAAQEYCVAIQNADGPDGIVAFTALPVGLAWATLEKVEKEGPGAKISRPEVFRIHQGVTKAISAGHPVFDL